MSTTASKLNGRLNQRKRSNTLTLHFSTRSEKEWKSTRVQSNTHTYIRSFDSVSKATMPPSHPVFIVSDWIMQPSKRSASRRLSAWTNLSNFFNAAAAWMLENEDDHHTFCRIWCGWPGTRCLAWAQCNRQLCSQYPGKDSCHPEGTWLIWWRAYCRRTISPDNLRRTQK